MGNEEHSTESSRSVTSSAPAATVLVIDDEAPVRNYLRFLLERDGHRVMEACDGEEALMLLRNTGVDLLITDLVMPVKEGVETIRTVREEYPAVPIIAISGAQYGETYLKVVKGLGARACLPKPLERKAVRETVAAVLRDRPLPA